MLIIILISLVLSSSSSLLLPTLLMSSIKLSVFTVHLFTPVSDYCAFQKHANSKVQKPSSQLHFSLQSIILVDLLRNRTLLKQVQKVMVCDL